MGIAGERTAAFPNGSVVKSAPDGFAVRTAAPLPDGSFIAVATGHGQAQACEGKTAALAEAAAWGLVKGWRK